MRRFLCAAVLALSACGGPTAPSNPTAIQFRLDSNSCGPIFGTNTLTFSFFVEGAQVGNATLGINATSPPFAVAAGSHVASASVTNSSIRWNNLNFSVTTGQTFTYVLLC
jgi:hypothetical protein